MLLTSTDCAGIFAMTAVAASKSIMTALREVGLSAIAGHVIKPDRTSPWPKRCMYRSIYCRGVAKLSADNKGINDAPVIVTYSAPLIQMEHLDSPLLWTRPSQQSDGTFCFRCVIFWDIYK